MRYMGSLEIAKSTNLVIIAGTWVPFDSILVTA